MDGKFVTVIIPVYNREKTILAAIESVLVQTYSNFELLVIDDGSTDDTGNIVKNIDDVRVRYVFQKNSGACYARNHGVDLACGEFIAFHDSDDLWAADKLEKEIRIIEKFNADVVCARMYKGDTKHIIPKYGYEGFALAGTDLTGIGTQTLLMRKHVLAAQRFDPTMPRLQELELLIRLYCLGYKIYLMKEPLVLWNIQSDSISSDPEKLFVAANKILEKYDNYDFLNATFGRIYSFRAYSLRKKGIISMEDYEKAAKMTGDKKEYGKWIAVKTGLAKILKWRQ